MSFEGMFPTRRFITIHPDLLDIVDGNYVAAALMHEIWWRSHDPETGKPINDGWVTRSGPQWAEILRTTPARVRDAIRDCGSLLERQEAGKSYDRRAGTRLNIEGIEAAIALLTTERDAHEDVEEPVHPPIGPIGTMGESAPNPSPSTPAPSDPGVAWTGPIAPIDRTYSADVLEELFEEPSEQVKKKRVSSPDGDSPFLADALRLCGLMAASLRERDPNGKPVTVTKEWVNDMRLMLDRDGRDPVVVEDMIAGLHAGESDTYDFWRKNVRCPKKLREKFAQVFEQQEREEAKKRYRSQASAFDVLRQKYLAEEAAERAALGQGDQRKAVSA